MKTYFTKFHLLMYSLLIYYREKETGDSKRPSLRVVAVEDLWEILMGV